MTVNIHITPTHFCYRCGAMHGDYEVKEDGTVCCGHCGESSVVTLQQASDMLNEYHLRYGPLESPEDEEGYFEDSSA